jgi:hypothetical protein
MIVCVVGSLFSRSSAMATSVEADSPAAFQIIQPIYLSTFLFSIYALGEAAKPSSWLPQTHGH